MATSENSTGFTGIHVQANDSDGTVNCVCDASGWLHQDNTKITSTAAELNILDNCTRTYGQLNLLFQGQTAGYGIKWATVNCTASVAATHHFTSVVYAAACRKQVAATLKAASAGPMFISYNLRRAAAGGTVIFYTAYMNALGAMNDGNTSSSLSYIVVGSL